MHGDVKIDNVLLFPQIRLDEGTEGGGDSVDSICSTGDTVDRAGGVFSALSKTTKVLYTLHAR